MKGKTIAPRTGMARRYGIKSADETRAYLAHPTLGSRLLACAEAVVANTGSNATEIFGSPDDLKLRSSATLFASMSAPDSVFHRLLEKFYPGGPVQPRFPDKLLWVISGPN
jgi:uncharacterized protein (DUF1810 family)